MQIKPIAIEHLDELLAFEVRNRAWFELHISPRQSGFYTRASVATHIEQLLCDFHGAKAYPGVIEEQGIIVGRVNLRRDADTQTLRLGYRIDHNHTARGLASAAVAQVCGIVPELFDCSLITAFVSVENLASQRVLVKNGFKARQRHPDYAMVAGRPLDCIEYALLVT